MAAPVGTHCPAPRKAKLGHDDQHRSASQQLTTASSQLLYSDSYAECYQESQLTVVDKRSGVKGKLQTVDVPQSSVLTRMRKFLPELSMANKEMAHELVTNPDSADKFNIEHVGECLGQHVEMNVSVVPPELLAEDDSSTEESSSDSDLDSDMLHLDNEGDSKPVVELQRRPKCVKPGIEVIEHVQEQAVMDR